MALPPIVALEIGTARVRALVGEAREDGHLMVTAIGEVRSIGVRKSEVIDFDQALNGVRHALHLAEEQSDVAVRRVHLVLSGARMRSDVNRGTVHVLNEDREVTPELMEQAAEAARTVNLPPDREILHSISQQYYVDAQEGVINPEGMEGGQLSLDMLIVHGQGNTLRNTVKVARSAGVDVEDVAFGGLCSALAVLTPEQKKSGALVLDLGAGTTDYLAYAHQGVAAAGSLAVGGEHVTNDIAIGLRIPHAQAEKLKLQHGSAVPPAGPQAPQAVSLPAEGGFQGRMVRLADLHTIIHARQEELLERVQAELRERGLQHHLGAGVVLTGGGALLAGMTDLVERVFNVPCADGRPRAVSGLASVTGGPEYAAAVGMLRYGMLTAPRDGEGGLTRMFKKLLGRT